MDCRHLGIVTLTSLVNCRQMTTLTPLVTIIIAVFNAEKFLQQCINSVTNQTYTNKQLIVIDGGSTDKTLEIIKMNQGVIDYYVSEKDRGIYHAWNKGLDKARGEWICFLGSDDYFYDNHALKNMLIRIQYTVPEEVQIVYGQVSLVNDDGKQLEILGEDWMLIKDRFKLVMCIPHPAVLHHRALFEEKGKFDEQFKIAGDYEMLLRVLKSEDAHSVMDVIVVAMRVGGVSSNPKNAIRSLKEMRLAQKMHGQRVINKFIFLIIAKEYLKIYLSKFFGKHRVKTILDLFRQLRGINPYRKKSG